MTVATFSKFVNGVGSAGNIDSQGKDKEAESSNERKKEVDSFNDLLNTFPMIARQMQGGLEKIFKDFHKSMNDWVPRSHSRGSSINSHTSSGSTTLRSNGSAISPSKRTSRSPSSVKTLQVDEEEDYMRRTLESTVNAAIDLFQKVDKQQLSFLGATTELTGPAVERLIERFVAEQLHDSFLFPRLCNSHKVEDVELESKVRGMQQIDVAQVGIAIEEGTRGKKQLISQINSGFEEFRKLDVAGSPQQMIEILLATQKLVTGQSPSGVGKTKKVQTEDLPSEKQPSQTINADTLVSLLLVVVIRSQVRHLHARLSYMRNFVFIEDVESGEIGYALSTFEAVLSYLQTDSAGLRKASRRNRRLWQATKKGDIDSMKAILEADGTPKGVNDSQPPAGLEEDNAIEEASVSSIDLDAGNRTPESSSLAHVFPFQASAEPRKGKRVLMDLRSLSNASENSFVSRSTTLDSSINGAIEGDTSVETIAQTQDVDGNSILMMAVEARQAETLHYLLSLEAFFPAKSIIEDTNNEGTTLLSAAVQLNSSTLTQVLLDRIVKVNDEGQMGNYLCKADSRGRTVAHYLFNAPWLLPRLGEMLPWRQKDKIGQTPLLALCRSYDHSEYAGMVNVALGLAGRQQGDGQPLHLDDHVDAKGNSLLHVINEPAVAVRLLQRCDADPNAPNDKRFTPLMVASKYGRIDLVRVLFGDPRVDIIAKEQRGMTAVELAKDDEVRNRIDDMVLVSHVPAADGRVTAVVRSFFVEDASVRMIIKSATRNDNGMIGVTTCRRSLTDFENLAKWLALEHPASWLPSIFNFRSPFQLASKPSRAVLQDMQVRLDNFLKVMLAHSTFSTHELLWEFILFPEIQPEMMASRSRTKANLRIENIREEYEAADSNAVQDISSFVEHARDSLRGVNHSTKSVLRRINSLRVGHSSKSFLPQKLNPLTSPRLSNSNRLVGRHSLHLSLSPSNTHHGLLPLRHYPSALRFRPPVNPPHRYHRPPLDHSRHPLLPLPTSRLNHPTVHNPKSHRPPRLFPPPLRPLALRFGSIGWLARGCGG